MAEILLQVVADTVLKKVDSLLMEQISLMLGFKKQLTSLSDSLTMIQAVLLDAERRQSRDAGVKVWLKRLKDVAYDADDVLDEFAYEILRRKVEIKNQMKRKCLCVVSALRFSVDLSRSAIVETWLTDVTSFWGLNAIQQHFTALIRLRLSGYGAEALPDCFSNLLSLRYLQLIKCERLKCLPAREPLAKLTYLYINNCPLLKERWSEIAPHANVFIDGTQVQYF